MKGGMTSREASMKKKEDTSEEKSREFTIFDRLYSLGDIQHKEFDCDMSQWREQIRHRDSMH